MITHTNGCPTQPRNGGIRSTRLLSRRRSRSSRHWGRTLCPSLTDRDCSLSLFHSSSEYVLKPSRQTPTSCKVIANFHVGSRITALAWSPRTTSPSLTDEWSIEYAFFSFSTSLILWNSLGQFFSWFTYEETFID